VNGTMTPAELAAYLRCSERTISRMVADGCPSMLVGSRRRFDLAAVIRWTEERAACPPEKTTPAAGTSKSASIADAFTAGYRRAQLRVMPSTSRPS
jgi:excisionase family DNA binding protein